MASTLTLNETTFESDATKPGHRQSLSEEERLLLQNFWLKLTKLINEDTDFEKAKAREEENQSPSSIVASATSYISSFWGGTSASNTETVVKDSSEGGESSPVAGDVKAIEWNHALDTLFLAMAYEHPDSWALRFLRARKWDLEQSVKMAIECLRWRSKFDVKRLLDTGEQELIKEDEYQMKLGKGYIHGRDNQDRPIFWIHAKDHIAAEANASWVERAAILTYENARLLQSEENETLALVFDLSGFGLVNMDYNFTKFIISCFEAYYPESLGMVMIVNAPWVFNSCWAIISSMMDPEVKEKIQFVTVQQMTEFIDKQHLPYTLSSQLGVAQQGEDDDGFDPQKGYKYEFFPPTPEELEAYELIRSDKEDYGEAKKTFQDSCLQFYNTNLDWCKEKSLLSSDTDRERSNLIENVKDAYGQFVPFIRQKTHYHRIGLLKETAFKRI